MLGRRSEAPFLAEVARDWACLFPRLPHQSEASRRIRWLWGAFEQMGRYLADLLPADDCQQIDTSPGWVFKLLVLVLLAGQKRARVAGEVRVLGS